MRKPTQEILDEIRKRALKDMETNPKLQALPPEFLETYRQITLAMTSSPEAFMRLAPIFEPIKEQEAPPTMEEASCTANGNQ